MWRARLPSSTATVCIVSRAARKANAAILASEGKEETVFIDVPPLLPITMFRSPEVGRPRRVSRWPDAGGALLRELKVLN
jgi:hypothetical protein